jgi:hypothetical protein
MFEAIGGWGGSTGQAWKNLLVGSNLSDEGLLAREALQNSNDAHDANTGHSIKVRISRKTLSGQRLAAVSDFLSIAPAIRPRLNMLGLAEENSFSRLLDGKSAEVEFTIIEDFSTVGLGGALPNRHGAALDGDHFQKLLFLLGGTDKTKSGETSGGSFGYGKSVYSALSDARTVVYYSVFEPTTRSEGHYARFIACSLFDSHTFRDRNYTGRAYFGAEGVDGAPIPLVDEDAHECAKAFGLKQRSAAERGTTIAIVGTHINMDRLRSEIELYWWPKLVDQEMSVDLYDGDVQLTPPSPKANQSLKPFLTCYEILARRQVAEPENGQKLGKLRSFQDKALGEWAAIRADDVLTDGTDIDDTLLNKVALIRGAKMVVDYSNRFSLAGTQVAIAGVFMASADVDNILRLSEPPNHNNWSWTSPRLTDSEKAIVQHLLERLRQQIKSFHRDLLPPPPPTKARLKLLEELLGRLLSGEEGIGPPPEAMPDPFAITHKLDRKTKDGRVRIRGTVKLGIREDADEEELAIEYTPVIEILEDESLSSGGDLPFTQLSVESGQGKIELKNRRKVIVGTLRKNRPIMVRVESEETNREWALAYREELRAIGA